MHKRKMDAVRLRAGQVLSPTGGVVSPLYTGEMTLYTPAHVQNRGPTALCDLGFTLCREKWLVEKWWPEDVHDLVLGEGLRGDVPSRRKLPWSAVPESPSNVSSLNHRHP